MDLADLVHAADQEHELMQAFFRFVALGAMLFAAGRWIPLVPSPYQGEGQGEVDVLRASTSPYPLLGKEGDSDDSPASMSDEEILLAAARKRGLGDDDVVVRRRLVENASSMGIAASGGADAYQRAVSLRLDQGDPIVARRLVQQMRLQLETEARRAEPTEAELRQFLAEHSERFIVPERVRVAHVFFSRARRGEQAERDATACMVDCTHQRYPPDTCPDPLGDPCLWPAELPLQTATDLQKIFGAAAPAIAAAPREVWTGPHRSALGFHLVRVIERVEPAVPAFETVRTAVRLALLNERAERHVRETITALR